MANQITQGHVESQKEFGFTLNAMMGFKLGRDTQRTFERSLWLHVGEQRGRQTGDRKISKEAFVVLAAHDVEEQKQKKGDGGGKGEVTHETKKMWTHRDLGSGLDHQEGNH